MNKIDVTPKSVACQARSAFLMSSVLSVRPEMTNMIMTAMVWKTP
jgi:hypothetical protein